jgi:hypothetical protein
VDVHHCRTLYLRILSETLTLLMTSIEYAMVQFFVSNLNLSPAPLLLLLFQLLNPGDPLAEQQQ